MRWTTSRTTAATVMVVGLLALKTGARNVSSPGSQEQPPESSAEITTPSTKSTTNTDKSASEGTASAHDHPNGLETKALDRRDLPTLQKAQRELASEIFHKGLYTWNEHDGSDRLNELARWSREIVQHSDRGPSDQLAALSAHLDRIQALKLKVSGQPISRQERDRLVLLAQYHDREARLMLAQAKDKDRSKAKEECGTPAAATGSNRPTTDLRTQRILEQLEEPIDLRFETDTPLQEVLQHIKKATAHENSKGIPIYVDPTALQDQEKSLTSPVTIDLEEVPLKTGLALLLRQLGLAFKVQGGVLIITSLETDELDTPIDRLEAKARHGELTAEEAASLKEMLKTLNEIQELQASQWRLEQERVKTQEGMGGGHFGGFR